MSEKREPKYCVACPSWTCHGCWNLKEALGAEK